MLVAVAVAAGLDDRIAEVEMRNIRAQRADDETAGLIGRGEVAQIDDETEVVVRRAHVGSKTCSQGCRTDQRCLVHVKVEDLHLDHHVLFRRIIAQRACGLEKLRIRLLLRVLLPVPGEERNAL